ncbi:hypothetical protein M0R45_015752 [Rubus argutus]|uniref:Uncharacterized protein n=1 Tax=Rubus argutus TaxID=59490 RepID=A0AAW1XT55_RUBAR
MGWLCQAIANVCKSSLSHVGLDKMLVDNIGDVTITNNGATILKMLEVEHPAAKWAVHQANVKHKIHPTSIINGYRLAMRETCKYVEEKIAVKVRLLLYDGLDAKENVEYLAGSIVTNFFSLGVGM